MPGGSRAGRRATGLVGAALILLGCGTTTQAIPIPRPPTMSIDTSFATCDEVACTGVLGGARYEIKLPAKWNGTLLLWSHGYRLSQPTSPNGSIQTHPESAPSAAVAQQLLARGYALAGSAYARNGWAVSEGVRAGEQLYELFARMVGKPQRTFVWGASLGGLITQTLAERHPDWVTAVGLVCGVLAGAKVTFDLALDVTYAIKTLIYGPLKLANYSSVEEARANFTGAVNAITAASRDQRGGVPKLLLIGALIDAPKRSTYADGHDAASRLRAVVESLERATVYGTAMRWDLEQRAGGNPSSNVGTDYSARVTAAEAAEPEALWPGSVARSLALLAQGRRVDADPGVRERADDLGNPSGVLVDPTVTLHTVVDPLVIVQNQSVFRAQVAAAAGAGTAKLLQLYTRPPLRYTKAPYGAGHCNFTTRQWVGVANVLDLMAGQGSRPSSAAITAAFAADPALALNYVAPPWPAFVD